MVRCPECSRTFGSPHALKIHQYRAHENRGMPKQFACKHCGQRFERVQQLAAHVHYDCTKKPRTTVAITNTIPTTMSNGVEAQPTKRPYNKKQREESPTMAFCPCCGLNIRVITQAINIAQSMKGGGK